MHTIHQQLIDAAARLSDEVAALTFGKPVTHVYNPLQYAWQAHRRYLLRANPRGVDVLLMGMNPGPWGMAQTGVPFGEIAVVRDWIGIDEPVESPADVHPKRPIEGFQCQRSEVSGRRLWGLFRQRFGTADKFFARHFVANYCPRVFMEESARNRTPDKLGIDERAALSEACDRHLESVLSLVRPKLVVGVGRYAEQALLRVARGAGSDAKVTRILHPSPASPAANRDWAGTVTGQLEEAGVWGRRSGEWRVASGENKKRES